MVPYSYYIEIYRGTSIECPEEFERLAMRAAEYVDGLTLGRARLCAESDAVKKACCALAEAIDEEEKRDGKTSESVGAWSVSYGGREEMEKRKRDIVTRYLLPTGLLYRGMG